MECAIVSLAYHLEADQNNEIVQCGIAIGSAAPTNKFCKSACEYLMGKIFNKMTDKESEEFASLILEYASPISDIRASAWYRKQVLFNIAKGIFENKD
jgi:CO/xanthine dehydrogenase FAD-binding subunit